jgi:hypothetical protein
LHLHEKQLKIQCFSAHEAQENLPSMFECFFFKKKKKN